MSLFLLKEMEMKTVTFYLVERNKWLSAIVEEWNNDTVPMEESYHFSPTLLLSKPSLTFHVLSPKL